MKEMTWWDVYKEFLAKTKIPKELISDFRPCDEMFDVPTIPGAIVIWLKSGQKLIYIMRVEDVEKEVSHE